MTAQTGITVLAFDLDGTLLEEDDRIRNRAQRAIERALDAGLRVVTASGRRMLSQAEVLADHGLVPGRSRWPHALTSDERAVWLPGDGEWLPLEHWNRPQEERWARVEPLARELLAEAMEAWESAGLKRRIYVNDEKVRQRCLLGVSFREPAEAEPAALALRERVEAASPELTVSYNAKYVHILLSDIGKGLALKALADHWGVPCRQFLAVGDQMHDEDMLDGRYGFAAAVVGNAAPALKELVDDRGGYVAKYERGKGVKEIIDAVLEGRLGPAEGSTT